MFLLYCPLSSTSGGIDSSLEKYKDSKSISSDQYFGKTSDSAVSPSTFYVRSIKELCGFIYYIYIYI